MSESLISVVIPSHNGGRHLAQCLRSVLDQETDCEIIVVDDGSTDDTASVARSLMQSCPMPLIVISQRNAGPAAARNVGLRAAAGKYICFLDVDDRYLPGFFPLAIQVLDADLKTVAVYCEIEILGTDRPVQDWQRCEAELCLPGNIILRTEAARQMGGFPDHPALRGRAAGEDVAFRAQLHAFGQILMIQKCFFQYHVTEGSHFHFFLDRSSLVDGKVVVDRKSLEELDRTLDEALDEYRRRIERRINDKAAAKLQEVMASTQSFMHLAAVFQRMSGMLHPYEGYVLYTLARYWLTSGRIVEIGNCQGQSTGWLAAGGMEGKRSPVAAIESDPSTLPLLQGILAEFAMSENVVFHSGFWSDPIRLLFLDGHHCGDALQSQFAFWQRFLPRGGLVIVHGIGVRPGIKQFFESLLAQQNQWRFFGQFNSLGILERIASPEKATP